MSSATLLIDLHYLSSPMPEGLVYQPVSDYQVAIQTMAGTTIRQVIECLGLPLSQAVVAVVNGRAADLDQILEPGDQVRLLPQIAGGD